MTGYHTELSLGPLFCSACKLVWLTNNCHTSGVKKSEKKSKTRFKISGVYIYPRVFVKVNISSSFYFSGPLSFHDLHYLLCAFISWVFTGILFAGLRFIGVKFFFRGSMLHYVYKREVILVNKVNFHIALIICGAKIVCAIGVKSCIVNSLCWKCLTYKKLSKFVSI